MIELLLPNNSPLTKTKFWYTNDNENKQKYSGYMGCDFSKYPKITIKFESEDSLNIFLLTVE